MSNATTYPLRLPRSVKAAVEKLSAMNTAAFFAERRERADFEAFGRIMRRKGGELPREGDERV